MQSVAVNFHVNKAGNRCSTCCITNTRDQRRLIDDHSDAPDGSGLSVQPRPEAVEATRSGRRPW